MKKYQIIYADPPWEYSGNAVIAQKSLINNTEDSHYMPMSLKGIKDLNVNNITDDNALLFLWATSPRLPFAIETIISWGFQYSTVGFVWNKEMTNPGFYTLSSCEICLIGKKGKIPTPRGARNIRQFLSEKRTEHSKKPDEIRNQIVKMFPTQKKIELFARQKTEGWDTWGNEVDNDITL